VYSLVGKFQNEQVLFAIGLPDGSHKNLSGKLHAITSLSTLDRKMLLMSNVSCKTAG
jgi:hypothetical protein